ncbi:Cofilin [Bifiguratus adelaidae]|uniref:Cofilin n=1 Tax=Bifiguratus adelaidae TaxID=1938954 RepID=A0A261XVD9_9FUNG|nr:Cofilin [Bifiguratus adelaidae]
MSSGVTVSDACLEAFQQLKLGKKYQYVIFKISDDMKEIVVEKAESGQDYDAFIAALPADEPRYAVYDFQYEKGDEGIRNKITFYTWTPDTAKIRQKMVYASSKEGLRRKLVGIAVEVQGTDFSEVDYQTVLEKVSRSSA